MADRVGYAEMKVRAAVAEVIAAEALEPLIADYEAIEARRAEARMVLTAVWSLVSPQDSKRVDLALAERPLVAAAAETPPGVRVWWDFLGALATDAAAPLPGV
jgi:hypothetical protein